MAKKKHYEATRALKEMVGASLPNRHMPSRDIDTVYRKTGGPHVAWKWVTAKGMLNLLVEIPREYEWSRIVFTAFVDYPGITKKPRLIYRNETSDLGAIPYLVEQVVREFDGEGL